MQIAIQPIVAQGGRAPERLTSGGEPAVYASDHIRNLAVARQIQQARQRRRNIRTVNQHSQPMAMRELKMRSIAGHLRSQAKHAEFPVGHIGVVKQHDGAVGKFSAPGLKVAPRVFVKVLPIDMKEIDRAVGEPMQRIIERALDQCRKSAVARIVI